MKIIEFNNESEAQAALDIFNAVAAAWWAAQGYRVEDGRLIGKNAKTGQDAPDKAHTITWDVVRESPDGTWYWTSPASDPRFVDWRDYLPEGASIPEDKEMPEAWLVV